MQLEQRLSVPRKTEIDLEERVRLIVELWGEGEALEEDRVAEIARNLYGAKPEEVREAILANLRDGRIKGKFYIPGDSRSKAHRRRV